ncbi:MAG: serine protease [Alphaproteobacteria bacterium]
MSLIVRHLEGPLAGQTQTFEDTKARVSFGRNGDVCDVVFPEDCTIVGREHFALDRKFAGSYEIDLNKAHYVEIDGDQAYENDTIPGSCRVRLGGKDGPLFEVEVGPEAADADMLATLRQRTMRQLPEFSRRNRRLLIGLCAVFVVSIATIGIYTTVKEDQWTVLSKSIENVRETQQRNATRLFSPEVLTRLKESVYVAVMRDSDGRQSPFATAFAIGPNLLATNAHVAEVVLKGARGLSYYVSQSRNGRVQTYRITKAVIHPAYKRFEDFTSKADLVSQGARGGAQPVSFAPSYDVGLLFLESKAVLNPYLPLAGDDTLHSLVPGDPLAYCGFPMENLAGTPSVAVAPDPQVQIGVLTSATNFFSFPVQPGERQLLRYSMGVTGGASGSPIINSKGEVVGTVNGINLMVVATPTENDRSRVKFQRIPSAVNINFGQRADLIKELVAGVGPQRLAQYEKSWKSDAAKFVTWKETISAFLDNTWKLAAGGKRPKTIARKSGTLDTFRDGLLGYGVREKFELPNGRYGFQTITDRANDINLYLYRDNVLLKSSLAKSSFTSFEYRLATTTSIEVVVASPKVKGIPYDLKIVKLD